MIRDTFSSIPTDVFELGGITNRNLCLQFTLIGINSKFHKGYMYELVSAFATQKFAVFENKFFLECYSQGPKRSPITKFYNLFE